MQGLGEAVLAQAFDAAAPQVGRRARLRSAPEADVLRAPLSAAGLQPERALHIARDLLQLLEPAWISSFPTTPSSTPRRTLSVDIAPGTRIVRAASLGAWRQAEQAVQAACAQAEAIVGGRTMH